MCSRNLLELLEVLWRFTFSRPSSSFLGVGWSKSNCYIYGRVYLFGYQRMNGPLYMRQWLSGLKRWT